MFHNGIGETFVKMKVRDGARKKTHTTKAKMLAKEHRQFELLFERSVAEYMKKHPVEKVVPRAFAPREENALNKILRDLGYRLTAAQMPDEARGFVGRRPNDYFIAEANGKTRLGYFHQNPDGTNGGFVEIDCKVDASCTVDEASLVLNASRLYPKTYIAASVVDGAKIEQSDILHADVYDSVVVQSTVAGCGITACTVILSKLSENREGEVLIDVATPSPKLCIDGEKALEMFLDALFPVEKLWPEGTGNRKNGERTRKKEFGAPLHDEPMEQVA